VQVSAKDKATGKEQQIRIQASGGLSEADIEKMVKDAESNAESDKKRRELVETTNQAETLIHNTEKSIKDLGAQVPDSDKKAAEDAIADLKTALEGTDKEAIESKMQALMQASMKIGGSPDNAAAAENPATPGDDGVLEADFTDLELDDDDKGKK
jgi:molecular chaperone DnaK